MGIWAVAAFWQFNRSRKSGDKKKSTLTQAIPAVTIDCDIAVYESNLRPSVTIESMKCTVAVSLVFLSAVAYSFAQQSDCPAATVINNGVCIGEDGRDCSKREAQSRICFDPEPQYTEKAAKADIRGTVRLTATIGTNGCAKDIMVISPLGHGLDESAVSALQRWRFRKPPRAVRINIEFNFDPKSSSRNPVTAPTCAEVSGDSATSRHPTAKE